MSLKKVFLSSLSLLVLSSIFLIGVTYLYDPAPIRIVSAVHTNTPADSVIQVLGTSSLTENQNVNLSTVSKDAVTILLIGLDSRRGDKTHRCDAIHLFTFNRKEKTLHMINIPRGTPLAIPGYDENFSIVSNACAIFGIDAVRTDIEKMTNLKIDYMVKIGFSQAVGGARLLGLPSMDTLTSLRSRAYPTGDNQRSYNQAVFLRDIIGKHLSSYPSLPKPLKYIAFNMLETDIDFNTADELLTEASQSPFANDPALIPITSFSPAGTKLKDIHVLQKLEIATSSGQMKDSEAKEYQQNLIAYLQNQVNRSNNFLKSNRKDQGFESIQTSFSQELWLQIEDEVKRDEMHFEMLKSFALSSPSGSESSKLLLDFITEMDQKGNIDLKEKAQEILNNL